MPSSPGRRIGGSLRDAISWTQDRLRTTRPLAEQVVLAAMADGQAVWGGGHRDARSLFLLEDDDELEKRRRKAAHKAAARHSAGKRWRRSSFRNAARHQSAGRRSAAKAVQQAASGFSNAAEEMEHRSVARLLQVEPARTAGSAGGLRDLGDWRGGEEDREDPWSTAWGGG